MTPNPKERYGKIRSEFDKNFIPIESGYVGVLAHSKWDVASTSRECLWQFIVNSLDQQRKEIRKWVRDYEPVFGNAINKDEIIKYLTKKP